MDQRVSLVTLGVEDLARARAFYEALGWRSGAQPADDVVFFQAGGMIVGLWGRAALAQDSGVEDLPGFGSVTLAYNVGSPAEVDAVLAEAARGRRDDHPRGRRDLLGRLHRRLPRPRRAPLGDRPQPPLDARADDGSVELPRLRATPAPRGPTTTGRPDGGPRV